MSSWQMTHNLTPHPSCPGMTCGCVRVGVTHPGTQHHHHHHHCQHHHMLDSGLGLVSHPGTETEMTETQILPLQAFKCAAVASRSYCGQHDLQHLGFRLSFHFIFVFIFTELLFCPRGQLPRKNALFWASSYPSPQFRQLVQLLF